MAFARVSSLVFVPFGLIWAIALVSITSPVGAQTISPSTPEGTGTPESQSELDTDPRPLAEDNSFFSLEGGRQLMTDARSATAAQNYDLAVQKLQSARRILNQLSVHYQELSVSFSGIDNRIVDRLRQDALETAQLRDDATYQLALVYREKQEPAEAIPLLLQVIGSQQPARELGRQSYQQLFEIGFVELSYPSEKQETAPTPTPPPSQTSPDSAQPTSTQPTSTQPTGTQSPSVQPSNAQQSSSGEAEQPTSPIVSSGVTSQPAVDNPLSVARAKQRMAEAEAAINTQNYDQAAEKLQQARELLNTLSKNYQDLSANFVAIDNPISDNLRGKALETAQLRDDATYQLALVHRAQNKPELAVPLLAQIIKSQLPTRQLGQKAYQQLLELGFVDTPYPRTTRVSPPSSSPSR